ncbi:NLR family CARD domain-containing protein 4-like isoform X2 [Branchiostoma floridae]|uniref:NLR family CARD domain-containing protein 4-like isoform X2 n=1 Tax=Branchiostoma floridae TaxID=7739 RepID=A0A9J7N385_BRAFL|nr:NLR family CARD domain-containing protein 4-like isoform X2 [Branchiostoma floridae]XP_035691443.1 NLR family CARD domain-containing protein 4-like isoform X2 [Branchiostoma floridae]
MSDLDRFTDLDPIFAQWAQEKLRKKFRRPKYKTLVAVDTKDLSVNHYEETYHREGRKEEVTCNESKEEVENNSDNVMEHMITAADTTKSSYEWSQTKGYKLSASVSVNVGLPEIGGGLLVKGGAEFQLFKKKTKKRETEDSHGHQTKVDVQPWSKVKVSIETKKKVHKMGFSLKFYLQGKVTVQMKKESGKTKTVTGDVVDILQKYGTVETDTSGERTVCLSIEGTFEGMTRIDRKVNVNTTALSTKIDKDTDVFKTSVKDYYEVKLTTFNPMSWNDGFSLTYDEIFTELELVQILKFKTKKESIQSEAERAQKQTLNSLDDLFNPDVTGLSTAPRCILIEGEAGGGKTTFLSKEAIDAVSQKTELGRRHDIALFFRLREVREEETIEEMVWDQCVPETTEGIDVQSIRAILKRNESRVLFLLDGYDELWPEARAARQAIPKLLSGKFYPNSTIVITSRPSAGVQQYTRPDCHVHIMGFSPKHMVKYVRKYFITNPELAEDFIMQYFTVIIDKVFLKTQDLFSNLIQTPMFLMLVCVLWEEDQEMVSTGTMTGLYDNLLTCLVRKYCKREGVDMPTEGLPTEVAMSLLQFGKLALEALLRNKTLLDVTEVERENVNWELLLKLGVVSLEVSSSKLHPRKQLNFSHKTMQEFLAGRYVAHALLNQDIVELLQLTSINKVFELSNLLQFTCGCDSRAAQAVMEELSNLSKKEFSDLRLANFQKKSHLPVKAKSKKSVQTYKRFMSLCLDVLNERKELHVLQAVSKALPVIIMDLHMNGMFGLNSKQHAALKYYMENMQSSHLPDRVILEPFLVNVSKSLQYLEQLVTSPIPGLKVDLRLMYVTFDSPVPDKTVQHLQQCLPGLRVDLYVSGQCNSPDETARLASFLKNVPGLRALDLSRTRLTPSSLQPLVQGFSHMSLLEELDLTGNRGLGDAGMEVLQVGLSSVPHLAVLRLRDVTMTAVGMSSLAPYMRHLVGLRELDISYSYKIGDTRLESLTTVLPIFTAMQVLVLQCIGISPTGMRTLVPALCQLTRLIKLDFSWNDIGDPGLECLAAILPHLTAMKVLVLSVTGISDRGISALIKALPHLVQLQVLGVSGNNIGDSGIVSLVQTLCQPSSLDMEQNPPGDKSLTTAPHYNTTQPGTLQELSIGRNRRVTGAGLGRVAQLISALPALTRLDMSGYREHTPAHLSDTAAMALAEALPRLPALEELKLFVISMEPAGFQAVVQAAEEHPTLERLIYTKRLVPEGADTTASCLRLR